MLRRPVVRRVEQIGEGIFLRRKSKFTRSVRQTRKLSPKKGNRLYYKGKGGNKGGRHTSKGKYIIDPEKLLTLRVPDLTDFKLKPYVSAETPKANASTE